VYHVGRLTDTPSELDVYDGRSTGFERRVLFGARAGSPHQEAAVGQLDPGGKVDRHLHAYEQAVYVLEGTLTLEVAGTREELGPDDYVFVDRGVVHELRNESSDDVQWFEVSAPRPSPALDDTIFVEGDAPAVDADPPYLRAHFDVTTLPEPSGQILAGFSAANVGGAALEIILSAQKGTSQFNLMVVQYWPGGFINEHDHAFEEGFFFVEGEVEVELEGETHELRAGDYMWSSVGSMHAMRNSGDGPARWIETQVPQPPSRYQARFVADWRRFVDGDES
jgi:quercetin dioxygenase-like cupin family protein